MSTFGDQVAARCAAEWELFDRGKRKEYQKKVFQRVGTYWKDGADVPGRNGRTNVSFGSLNKDKEDVIVPDSRNDNPPWSAAFISWIAKQSGAGNAFLYSGAHAKYILAALNEAEKRNSTAKFIAKRHKSMTPKVGDLIACGRERAKKATFDTAKSFAIEGFFPSHCDFVVEVDEANKTVRTIGGNVGNSVGGKNWPLDRNKRIGDHDPRSPSANVICIISCSLP
jgi:hypothetical protein